MERQPVESSNIASIGYDAQASILEIEFIGSGEVWQYPEFPDYMYEELMASDSKGKYFHKNIRGKYHEFRVS